MNVNKENSVPSVSTNQLINTLSETFIAYVKTNQISKHPSVFIEGQPGIGKSQSIYQIKERIEFETNKKVYVKDVRLFLYSPIDISGIPVADLEKMKAIWLKPDIFELDDSEDIVNILFLDELTSAPTSLQASAYQIALDKRVGTHMLPNNTFVIAAGNRIEDNSVTYSMPSALKNRFLHFKLIIDIDEWLSWAKDNDIHPIVYEFVKNNPQYLSDISFDTESNLVITPRSYEVASNLLKTVKDDSQNHTLIIESVLGKQITYLMFNKKVNKYQLDDILNNQITEPIDNFNDLNELMVLVDNEYEKYYEEKEKMISILNFIKFIPADYSINFIRKALNKLPTKYNLYEIESFKEIIDSYDTNNESE